MSSESAPTPEDFSRPLEIFFNRLSDDEKAVFDADYDRAPNMSLEVAFGAITDMEDARIVLQGIKQYLEDRPRLSLEQRNQNLLEISGFLERRVLAEQKE